jgi:hypothetical protein
MLRSVLNRLLGRGADEPVEVSWMSPEERRSLGVGQMEGQGWADTIGLGGGASTRAILRRTISTGRRTISELMPQEFGRHV